MFDIVLKIGKFLSALKHLPSALRLVREATGGWALVWAGLLLLQGLIPAAAVYLTRPFVDSLTAAIRAGVPQSGILQSSELRTVLLYGSLIALVMLTGELLEKALALVRRTQTELLRDHISALIHIKSLSADYSFYDLSEYYDHLYRARTDAVYRPEALMESLGSLAQNSVTLLAIGAVIVVYGWWLPVVLLASTLPALIAVFYGTLRQFDWQRRSTPDDRRTWYYDWLMTEPEPAAEMRMFDLGRYFQKAWKLLRKRLRDEQLRLVRTQTGLEFLASIFALIITLGALAWMVWQAVLGVVSLGVLAMFYQALNHGQRLLRSLLDNVGQLYSNSLFLGNLFEFLAMEPQVVDPPKPAGKITELRNGIRFNQITFSYPGSRGPVLKDFSLDIPAGKITAIVGLNGAGKSTLFKLLCRLYDVSSGSITIDGIDLRSMNIRDLRRMITILFQTPVRFNQTASDNIAFGDIESNPVFDDIEKAAIESGADEVISGLPDGYLSHLGKSFEDGTELSIGEWQRLALARAFLRRAPIILLDEPTSAIDSWAETSWMERFSALASGKTSIIITHRFTTARQADVIHVMVKGNIIESGTHDELVSLGGRYAQSWEKLMKFPVSSFQFPDI